MPSFITLQANGNTFELQLDSSAATQALAACIQDALVTYTARDYGNFERLEALGLAPTEDRQVNAELEMSFLSGR